MMIFWILLFLLGSSFAKNAHAAGDALAEVVEVHSVLPCYSTPSQALRSSSNGARSSRLSRPKIKTEIATWS